MQMGWSFLQESTKYELELSRVGGIPEQDVEQPSGKPSHLIAKIWCYSVV